MKKAKYNLSKSSVDRLMGELSRIAQENLDSVDDTGLPGAQITTNFVKTMTKVKGLEDVIERNEQLSKTYQGLLGLYGFDTMYDMYIYAKSCDLFPEEVFKSTDAIKSYYPVQRTIIRNGKPLDVTVWEKVFKSENKPKEEPKKEEQPEIKHARELQAIFHGEGETANTKNIAKLKATYEKMPVKHSSFNDKSSHYLTLKGEGKTAAVVGYSVNGEYYSMDFYCTNGQVSGAAARGFFEMLQLARRNQKGVKVKDNQQAAPVYAQAGLRKEGSYWVISYDELKEAYGESGNSNE
jgi:hypothetical protein